MNSKTRFPFIVGFTLILSFALIGCGSDEEPVENNLIGPTVSPSTPKPPAEDPIAEEPAAASDIDLQAEKAEIVELWSEYVSAFNASKLSAIRKLWRGQKSDVLSVSFLEADRISVISAYGKNVQNTMSALTVTPDPAIRGWKWNGSSMHEVYIRKRGDGRLEASAHGSNAFGGGQTWAYFQKEGDKWLISMVESVHTSLLAKHKKVMIREGNNMGYFDEPETRVP